MIDILHALSFPGMDILRHIQGDNVSAQLWFWARLLQAVTFCIAPWFIGRMLHPVKVTGVYLALTLLLFWSILKWHIVPDYYVNGAMTPLKIGSEFLVIGLLGLALVLWWRARSAFEPRIRYLIVGSLVFSIASETAMVLSTSARSPWDIAGHLLRILAAYLIYKAFVWTALVRPYDLLLRDLDEQQRRLQESELRYRSLVDLSPRGIAVICDGEIVYVNHATVTLLGAAAGDQLLGMEMLQFAVESDRQGLRERTQEVLGSKSPTIVREIHLRRLDGKLIEVESIAGQTLWHGRPAIELIMADISERKKAEKELLETKRIAESASRAKDHFLAVLSHELRTPLTPVLASVSGLLDGSEPLSPSVRNSMQVIQRNVELQARLVDDLLDLTRISRGKLAVDRQQVDAHDLIRNTIESFAPQMRDKSIHLKLELGATQTTLMADSARVQQILWNLLSNAVKFTPNGGTIGIATIDESYQDAVPVIAIRVSDNGVGIEPESIGRIFAAFEQANDAIHRRFGGLGLGLSISQSLAKAHGGDLEVKSDGKGKGSTFRLRLPAIACADDRVAAAPPKPLDVRVAPQRILLVEDHADSAKVIKALLQKDGHSVRIAGGVVAGLQAAGTDEFDVLITDIGLPDGSGLDLLRMFRKQHPRIVAVCMSGFGSQEDQKASRDAGALCHLVKPVTIQRLREAVRIAAAREPAT